MHLMIFDLIHPYGLKSSGTHMQSDFSPANLLLFQFSKECLIKMQP